MERLSLGNNPVIQEYLRDSKEFFPYYVFGYERMFKYLKEHHSLIADNILIGACGYGADVLGAGRIFPNALITAVSLTDFPEENVTEELNGRLTIIEATIDNYLSYAIKSNQQFDLIAFCNAPARELADTNTPARLSTITSTSGHILNYIQGGQVLPIPSMDKNFRRIILPRQNVEVWDCLLWKKR